LLEFNIKPISNHLLIIYKFLESLIKGINVGKFRKIKYDKNHINMGTQYHELSQRNTQNVKLSKIYGYLKSS